MLLRPNESVFDGAFRLAELGIPVVPLWGHDLGCCSCPRELECTDPGMHPISDDWPSRATTNRGELFDTLSHLVAPNIGVILGSRSGLVDIEVVDREPGWSFLNELFPTGLPDCPTYLGGNRQHRLFRWSPDLPDIARICYRGLDIHIGGNPAKKGSGDTAAFTVVPPSAHFSGGRYIWFRDIDDNRQPPALPANVIDFLNAMRPVCELYGGAPTPLDE